MEEPITSKSQIRRMEAQGGDAAHQLLEQVWKLEAENKELISRLKSLEQFVLEHEECDKKMETLRAIVGLARRLAYEIEGGNRWPVEWDEDTKIMPHLAAFKAASPLPEWERNGPGYKRDALSSPDSTEGV